MQLTLLGTGNAAGMPLYGCQCDQCLIASTNRKLQRTPCSALLKVDHQQFLLDAGQVNLAQRYPARSLAGIFLTHFHPDHVQGLFHLRWGTGITIPVFTPPDTEGCADLYEHPGILVFKPLRKFESFCLGEMQVTPLPLIHSKLTFGYLFERKGRCIAYLTDTKRLPPRTQAYLTDRMLDLVVIDCSYVPGNEMPGHNNLDDALDINSQIRPKRMVLTHLGHDLDIWLKANESLLPKQVVVGEDGMSVFPLRDDD
jgi:phosphoribosyl 1,2-cyclic phosphate phosphodiesterase